MKPLKLLISGPVGAGKTTFIQSLSEIPVVETDELASENIGKTYTTVAMDFGMLELDGIRIQLWGTPGQNRYKFMWDILAEGALGLILLVSGEQPQDFIVARSMLEYITSQHPIPYLLGVTRQDQPDVWTPEDVADFFGLPPEHVIGINATRATSSIQTLIALLEQIQNQKWRGIP
ncbi:MAG: hypothetical protein RLZZ156_1450 [Deinococcota bacterium]|jgi:uncharacterized protein